MADHHDHLPNWNEYTLEELEEALEGLDRQRFPERVRELEQRIRDWQVHPERHQPHHDAYLDAPDWENYDLEELQEALSGLDRERFPDREQIIRDLIEQRRAEHQPASTEALKTEAAPRVAVEDLPWLPWGLTFARLGFYLLAIVPLVVAGLGLGENDVSILLALKQPSGTPIGSGLLLLLALLIIAWPDRNRWSRNAG